ncbi:MAG: hypothetical protein H0V36_03975 [Chloroflexi bacterium]|nr:hypothetical protein [Chloroflexota bacterium]
MERATERHEVAPAAGRGTGPAGLTEAEAAARRAHGLGNDAAISSGRTYLDILRENALTVVNVLLMAIASVLVVLGLLGDAAVTAVLVVVNVVVGVFQETRAKRSLDRLSVLTRPTASVVRQGVERIVDPAEVVLGDRLIVRRGGQLMLDGVIGEGEIEVDESLLTGEIRRHPQAPRRGSPVRLFLRDRRGQLRGDPRRRRFLRQPVDRRCAGLPGGPDAHPARRRTGDEDDEPAGRRHGHPCGARTVAAFGTLPVVETARSAAVLVALVPQGLVVMVTVTPMPWPSSGWQVPMRSSSAPTRSSR